MGLFKNEVGRPSNETIKKRNIFKGICVLLVIVIIGLVCYILNDKGIINLSSKNKNGNDKIPTTTKEVLKEGKLSDEEGKRIVEEVFGKFTLFAAIDSKKLQLNNDNIKTYAAIVNTEEGNKKYTCKELFGNDIESFSDTYGEKTWKVEGLLCTDDYQTLYSYKDVNEQYKKMFGEKNNAAKYTIELESLSIASGVYGYSKTENGYSYLSCECGDGFPPMISGFKNTKKSGNTLTIDYAEKIIDDDEEYFTFNDGTKVKYDYKKDVDSEFSKYKDLIDVKYTLVFEEQSDGSYIFVKAK